MSDSHKKGKSKSVRKENEQRENEKTKAHYNRFQLQPGDKALMNVGNVSDEDFAPEPLPESITRREETKPDEATEFNSGMRNGGGSRKVNKDQKLGPSKRRKLGNKAPVPLGEDGQPWVINGDQRPQLKRREEHRLKMQRQHEEQLREAAEKRQQEAVNDAAPAAGEEDETGIPQEIDLPSVQAAKAIKASASPHETFKMHKIDFNDLAAVEWEALVLAKLEDLCRADPGYLKNDGKKAGKYLQHVISCHKRLEGFSQLLKSVQETDAEDEDAQGIDLPALNDEEPRIVGTPQEIFIDFQNLIKGFKPATRVQFYSFAHRKKNEASSKVKETKSAYRSTPSWERFHQYRAAQAEKHVWELIDTTMLPPSAWKKGKHPAGPAATDAFQPDGMPTTAIETSNWRENLPLHTKTAIDQLLANLAADAADLKTEAADTFNAYGARRGLEMKVTMETLKHKSGPVAAQQEFEMRMMKTAQEIFKVCADSRHENGSN